MKKQMITLAMTMLIGTTSVFGDATSVQAAENNLVIDGSQMTEEIAEKALGKLTYYEVTVTRTAIRSGAGSTYSVLQYAYKGELYKKIGESGDWIKIKYGTKYGYLNKSYLKKK